MCGDFTPPSVVHGVVYGGDSLSGTGGEGSETWVCRAIVDGAGLTVDRCTPVEAWFDGPDGDRDATDSPDSAAPTEPTDTVNSTDSTDSHASTEPRPSLTTFLADLPPTAAAGLDFPFGLPERVVAEDSWTAFLRDLPTWCSSPSDLRWRCERRLRLTDDSVEARLRATDGPLSALSPFDDRVVASTFFGLRDVLRPLVLCDRVRVPPMTPPRPDRPFVIEVYPAGTLVDLDLFSRQDDGEDQTESARREATVDGLSEAVDCDLDIADTVLDRVLDEDAALESLVAAYAVYRNTRSASALSVSDPQRLVEGQVFV